MEEKQEWTVERVMAKYNMSRSDALQALRLMGLGNRDSAKELDGTSPLGCEQGSGGWWHGGE
jgi:hypothetical protein